MLDSRQLRYFAAVVEHGSLAGASASLRVAASALSHHLAQMEAALGVQLFDRKPRGMEPTAAGQRLFDHARVILRTMDAAEADVREAGGDIAGDVSVGMAYSAVKAIGVDLARRILKDYPRVQLALSESFSGAALVHLLAADVDMALVFNPPSDAALKTVPVLEERLVCVGLPDLVGDTDEPIRFADVLDLPLVLLRHGISARALLDDVTLLKKMEASARLQMNSVQAIGGSAEAGLGCVIATRLVMREQLEGGRVRGRPIVEPELSRTLHLCELTGRTPTYAREAVKAVILELIAGAVRSGFWDARLIADGP